MVARPTEAREKRCLPTKSLQINDSTSRIRINYQIFKVASKTPSYVQIVQLFCKTGYFLALNVTAKKSRIIGIVNQSSESSKSLIFLQCMPILKLCHFEKIDQSERYVTINNSDLTLIFSKLKTQQNAKCCRPLRKPCYLMIASFNPTALVQLSQREFSS